MPVPDPLLSPTRLNTVADLALTDAPQQETFARLNRLAQSLLGVPISILSIITEDRQVHAAQAGMLDDTTANSQWPLSHSFCKHVAASGEALIVEDARNHPLVEDNLSVRDHDVIAYAGFPLRLSNGEPVGAFCAIDHQPRQWTAAQLTILKDLTGVAIDLLDHRRLQLGVGTRDLATGLVRPAVFAEQLGEMLARAKAHERVALVAVNLAEFQLFNDAWGHDGGDALLAEVALRLERIANARAVRGRVSRLAGDTFMVAVSLDRTEPRGQLEARFLSAITERSFEYAGEQHAVGARIATVAAAPGVEALELVNAANLAIGATRGLDSGGRPQTAQGPALRRLAIRNRLHGAELRDELAVHYQPVFDLTTRRIAGFEALLRWNHPELGAVRPDEFIPVAESSGAIVPIGEWVLWRALTATARWRAMAPDQDLMINVNVAPEQMLVEAFPRIVADLLERTGVPASALNLEITERTLGTDHAVMAANVEALRRLGVSLSLDDFGTGYSSIKRLAAAPLDELKIDRSFVDGVDRQETHGALISGINAMASALGMRVVAEGIETEAQLDVLTVLGCTHGQGYHLGRPMPEPDATFAIGEATLSRTVSAG